MTKYSERILDVKKIINEFLERNGIVLNNSGGKIKVSPDGLLLQSSKVAQLVKAEFAEKKREHLREGFEANNADNIFERTFTSQINRTQ